MKNNKFTVHPKYLYNQTLYMFGFVGLFGESKTSKKGGTIYVNYTGPILDTDGNQKA